MSPILGIPTLDSSQKQPALVEGGSSALNWPDPMDLMAVSNKGRSCMAGRNKGH